MLKLMADLDWKIRRARKADWDGIISVLEMSNFHHIGGAEMPSFPIGKCFVAGLGDRVIGVAGYRELGDNIAKTTLLSVDPAYRSQKIGFHLQRRRQDYLTSRGVHTLYTNTDDDRVVAWYLKNFGYEKTGKRIAKVESFGRDDRDEWINLKAELNPPGSNKP
jgi:N-acetylglutamate synthase-like GNAT family acetyltransferase